jgi:hypothetical protein
MDWIDLACKHCNKHSDSEVLGVAERLAASQEGQFNAVN